MTNYEAVKQMTVDEMAYSLMCPYDKDCFEDDFCKGKGCIECTKEWLLKEKEGAENET